jgi:mannobiose 2-epimerase
MMSKGLGKKVKKTLRRVGRKFAAKTGQAKVAELVVESVIRTDRLAKELKDELRHTLASWFPRSVDRDHGGFLCDFDHRWRPVGSQPKMLEFQARQTISAARSAARSPDIRELTQIAEHGFRYLKEKMWDPSHGGWFRFLDRMGRPLENATKHGHGMSYAISACVACYELSGDDDCLQLGKSGFAWLESHAHDAIHGGYFGYYRRDGTPILIGRQGLNATDAIGTPIGFKDANTTADILRALADLYRVWPDAQLRNRLEEVLILVRDRLIVSPGVMHMYAHPDWTPLPDLVRYGQVLRTTNHLLSAFAALGSVSETKSVIQPLIDTMLRVAWDSRRGGFHLAGSSFGPSHIENRKLYLRDKIWWIQAEGMKALLAAAKLQFEGEADYEAHFMRLWDYVKTYILDAKHGGWFAAGLDTNPEGRKMPKATRWKDSSHEVEALLDCLVLLSV